MDRYTLRCRARGWPSPPAEKGVSLIRPIEAVAGAPDMQLSIVGPARPQPFCQRDMT